MLQNMRDYIVATDEDERALIQAELVPDTREARNQTTLLPARRSFLSQTLPSSFTMSQNPNGSVTLEQTSIHIRILYPKPTGSSSVMCEELFDAD